MIAVTHGDRVVFPAVGNTKADVVAHYERVAPRMLRHIARRPLTIVRHPKGIDQPGVFVKNAPAHYPATLERIELPRKGGVTTHVAVATADDLAYLANQGAIEIHAPTVRAPELDRPDRLVVDLDPPPGEVALVRAAAIATRDELAALGLPTIPMTTGSKGYHLVAAIVPDVELDAISTTMHELATLLAARHPELMTTTFRVAKRNGKVFVDWLRNRYGATGVAPWSLRARPTAPVAVPIDWDELDRVRPDEFRLATIDARLDRDDPLATLAEKPVDAKPFVAAVHAAFESSGLVLERFDRFRD